MIKNPPIVIQLQELAVDSSYNISDLLRKALFIASKLKLKDIQPWILNELNGYTDIEQVPDYREIIGEVKAYNSFQRRHIPYVCEDAEFMQQMQRVIVYESIESLQRAVKENETNKKLISFSYPPEIVNMLMSRQNPRIQMIPTRLIGVNQLVAIVEKARTEILEWSLNLEASGILGEGLTFSTEDEKRIDESNPRISIAHFQGIIGDVHGGSISQTMSMHITQGNFESLAKHLESKGISVEDITALEQAFMKDPNPSKSGKFGERVSEWIGKMVGKAAEGSWDISVSVAANLLSSAITHFYWS